MGFLVLRPDSRCDYWAGLGPGAAPPISAVCLGVWGHIKAVMLLRPCLPPSAREPEIGVLRRKSGYMMKGCGVTGSGDASVTIRA